MTTPMTDGSSQLSEREQEILKLVATGATNQQIANSLNISVNTVKVHLRNIFPKIGAGSRTEATLFAMRSGLVQVGRTDQGIETPPVVDVPAAVEIGGVAPLIEPERPRLAVVPPSDDAASPHADAVTPRHINSWMATTGRPARWLRHPLFVVTCVFMVLLSGVGVWQLTAAQRQVPVNTPVPLVQSEKWQIRAPLTVGRNDFAVADYDNRLYVIGGGTLTGVSDATERFDPQSNTWVLLSAKPTPVKRVEAVTIGGRIYVPGGEQADGTILKIFEAYDPRNERWERLPDLPAPRSQYALAKVEGKLYMFGGWDGRQITGDVWSFDPAGLTWSKQSPLPTPRSNAGAAVLDNMVYVMGGETSKGAVRTNERYDASADGRSQSWSSALPLPAPMASPAVTTVVNQIVVFDALRHTALRYTQAEEKWSGVALPADTALSNRMAQLGTNLIVFGPLKDSGPVAVSQYEAVYTRLLPFTLK
ncbi:MAG: kelch repeat-containing protein [Herpetosiphon sp.]